MCVGWAFFFFSCSGLGAALVDERGVLGAAHRPVTAEQQSTAATAGMEQGAGGS